MPSSDTQTKYAYLVTLVGVALAAVATAYNAVRSYLVSQMLRSRPFNAGNFTGGAYVTFVRTRQFALINPYGGLVGGVTILAVVIAVVGVVWLGLTLRKPKPSSP
jgi:hypothetical protein